MKLIKEKYDGRIDLGVASKLIKENAVVIPIKNPSNMIKTF